MGVSSSTLGATTKSETQNSELPNSVESGEKQALKLQQPKVEVSAIIEASREEDSKVLSKNEPSFSSSKLAQKQLEIEKELEAIDTNASRLQESIRIHDNHF